MCSVVEQESSGTVHPQRRIRAAPRATPDSCEPMAKPTASVAFDPAAAGVDEGFARTAVDAARIIAAARIPLAADPDDPTRSPQVTAEIIWLN